MVEVCHSIDTVAAIYEFLNLFNWKSSAQYSSTSSVLLEYYFTMSDYMDPSSASIVSTSVPVCSCCACCTVSSSMWRTRRAACLLSLKFRGRRSGRPCWTAWSRALAHWVFSKSARFRSFSTFPSTCLVASVWSCSFLRSRRTDSRSRSSSLTWLQVALFISQCPKTFCKLRDLEYRAV